MAPNKIKNGSICAAPCFTGSWFSPNLILIGLLPVFSQKDLQLNWGHLKTVPWVRNLRNFQVKNKHLIEWKRVISQNGLNNGKFP